MPTQNNDPKSGGKIEIFKMANYLKNRLGSRYQDQDEGFIAPELIIEADKAIADSCKDCQTSITAFLESLSKLWTSMKDIPQGAQREDLSRQIFTLSHEIKDVSALCGYELLSYFAESLRDYINKAELNIQAQVVIIQAHMDAMMIVHKQGFKKDAGPEAEELKKMVARAIAKYS
jgi:hypothetical protein